MFEHIRRISNHSNHPADAELNDLLQRFGALPQGYFEWQKELGEGSLCGELAVHSPRTALEKTEALDVEHIRSIVESVGRRLDRAAVLGSESNGALLIFDCATFLYLVHPRDREVYEIHLSRPNFLRPLGTAVEELWPSQCWFIARVPRVARELKLARAFSPTAATDLAKQCVGGDPELYALDMSGFAEGVADLGAIASWHWPRAGGEIELFVPADEGTSSWSISVDADSAALADAFVAALKEAAAGFSGRS